jgi:hypothetical protein
MKTANSSNAEQQSKECIAGATAEHCTNKKID